MLVYIAKRLVFVIPVVFAVALVCFLLVHIAPGDPLVSVLPPDASQALADQMRKAYGFDRPLPVQFGLWAWKRFRFMILPAVTMSVIPMGIVTRTVRALVGDLLSQEFVTALRAKGLTEKRVFAHVAKNAAPTAIAVMGLQLGYLLGGSILIETVFPWPGTGFLFNSAIFQRDLPLLQGTILVLALFFVMLNLVVDVLQALIDPRIKRT